MAVSPPIARGFWKVVNPLTRHLAGYAPWWVLLETTGRRTGKRRLTPFASGPLDRHATYLITVYGHRSAFAHNIVADPHVRLKRRGRWRSGTAAFIDTDEAIVRRFNAYARGALRIGGEDARLLRIDFDDTDKR
ncbi:MAG: nitroreductase family deazaflavin-dependent oxidoreductase [Actinobacteria bacterium]|nr:nitroreductase family deazaflavin-dependent oxidoreductase [Actinomycetota bacterium]